jgi:hypothetical protein
LKSSGVVRSRAVMQGIKSVWRNKKQLSTVGLNASNVSGGMKIM